MARRSSTRPWAGPRPDRGPLTSSRMANIPLSARSGRPGAAQLLPFYLAGLCGVNIAPGRRGRRRLRTHVLAARPMFTSRCRRGDALARTRRPARATRGNVGPTTTVVVSCAPRAAGAPSRRRPHIPARASICSPTTPRTSYSLITADRSVGGRAGRHVVRHDTGTATAIAPPGSWLFPVAVWRYPAGVRASCRPRRAVRAGGRAARPHPVRARRPVRARPRLAHGLSQRCDFVAAVLGGELASNADLPPRRR